MEKALKILALVFVLSLGVYWSNAFAGPMAAAGAGEIRVLANGLAAALGTAELDRNDDDLQAGRFGDRSFLEGLERRFEEIGNGPGHDPDLEHHPGDPGGAVLAGLTYDEIVDPTGVAFGTDEFQQTMSDAYTSCT